MFSYKNQFVLIFSFLSIPIELWESTAAIFRQSAVYVSKLLTIPCCELRYKNSHSLAVIMLFSFQLIIFGPERSS